jgi:hypothetical protein
MHGGSITDITRHRNYAVAGDWSASPRGPPLAGACRNGEVATMVEAMSTAKPISLSLSDDFWRSAAEKLENARNFLSQDIETRQEFRKGSWRLDSMRKPTGYHPTGLRQRDISTDLDQLPYYLNLLETSFDRFEYLFNRREASEEFVHLYGEICECVGFITDRFLDDSDELIASRKSNSKPVENQITWYCKAIVAQIQAGRSLAEARDIVHNIISDRADDLNGHADQEWYKSFHTDSGDIRRVFHSLTQRKIEERSQDRFAEIPDL